jgi:sulfide:quinone oxidoreductase
MLTIEVYKLHGLSKTVDYGVAGSDNTMYKGTHSTAVPSPTNSLKKELFVKYFMWSKGDLALEKYFGEW